MSTILIMNCYKLLTDYRLACNIQIIKLEWSDLSSWGQDLFRGFRGLKPSRAVMAFTSNGVHYVA